MITDENGVKHPETVEEQVQLRREEEQTRRREKFWKQKSKSEGWTRPQHSRGADTESEKKAADRFFANKAKLEGWSINK